MTDKHGPPITIPVTTAIEAGINLPVVEAWYVDPWTDDGPQLRRAEFAAETPRSYWTFRGTQVPKRSGWRFYAPTPEAALAFEALRLAPADLERLRNQIQQLKESETT